MKEPDFGKMEIKLKEMIEKRKISKIKVCHQAYMQSAQLNHYCRGEAQRVDYFTLTKLCYVLDCAVSDLLVYIPPESIRERRNDAGEIGIDNGG